MRHGLDVNFRPEKDLTPPSKSKDDAPVIGADMDWTGFTEEIQLPSDVAPALMCGRTELLMLAKRPMSADEVGLLLNAMRVLMDTNRTLQTRCSNLHQKLRDNVLGSLKGVQSSIHKIIAELTGNSLDDDEDDE